MSLLGWIKEDSNICSALKEWIGWVTGKQVMNFIFNNEHFCMLTACRCPPEHLNLFHSSSQPLCEGGCWENRQEVQESGNYQEIKWHEKNVKFHFFIPSHGLRKLIPNTSYMEAQGKGGHVSTCWVSHNPTCFLLPAAAPAAACAPVLCPQDPRPFPALPSNGHEQCLGWRFWDEGTEGEGQSGAREAGSQWRLLHKR